MITKTSDYQPTKKYLVCVDSDGCAMDTMNIKHIKAFGPVLVDEWQLEEFRETILKRWNEFNLFQITRGINRFKGLEKMLTELVSEGIPIEGYEAIKQWTDTTSEFSNPSLEREIEKYPDAVGLKKALSWSNQVNSKIKQLPDVGPFDHVKETLSAISTQADIVIVSSANLAAVEYEWSLYGFTPYLTAMFAQEAGTKSFCIEHLSHHYPSDHIIMLGDALGDYEAAADHHVFFYPILANHEGESWLQFKESYFTQFINGELNTENQKQLYNKFEKNLNGGTK